MSKKKLYYSNFLWNLFFSCPGNSSSSNQIAENSTGFFIIFASWAETNLSLGKFFRPVFRNCLSFCPANFQMKSPFAESCTLLFIFCNFSTKTFDCSRNYILRSSELLFPPFRSLSGGKIELREFISAGFSKLQLLCPVDIHMKNFLARMCKFLFFFWTFSRKNLRIQQKKNRPERQSCFFRVKRNFVQKNISPWTTSNFSISFWLWAKKTSFFNKTYSAELWKLLCLMSTKHFEEISVHWKNYNFFHFFPHFDQKNLEFSKIVSVGLSKQHFWCPVNTFRWSHLIKWIQICWAS